MRSILRLTAHWHGALISSSRLPFIEAWRSSVIHRAFTLAKAYLREASAQILIRLLVVITLVTHKLVVSYGRGV